MSRAQSAVEFLTTYSFVFLIIAIALFILLIYASIPKAILPAQCTFYGGFNCLDIAYFNTGSGGSELVILASDKQIGTVNITSFNATMDNIPSTGGYCTPATVIPGQNFYCIATFSGTATTKTYVGTFSTAANYCANSPSGLSNYSCPSGSGYRYGGSFKTEGSFERPPFPVTFEVSTMLSPVSNVLQVDGQDYSYDQLPLSMVYQPGIGHTILYSAIVPTSGNYIYIYDSISGCGVTTEGAYFVVTQTCTIKATYTKISYGDCSQIKNTGGQNLRKITAIYCDLLDYYLAGDNIDKGNLYGSNLQGANLDGTNLNYANLSYSNLAGAQIEGTNLNYVNLAGSNLQGATLSGSNLNDANLEYADLQGVDATGVNFEGANLQYANLKGADLAGSNFENANLAYANLQGANISGANFLGAYMLNCTGCP